MHGTEPHLVDGRDNIVFIFVVVKSKSHQEKWPHFPHTGFWKNSKQEIFPEISEGVLTGK